VKGGGLRCFYAAFPCEAEEMVDPWVDLCHLGRCEM